MIGWNIPEYYDQKLRFWYILLMLGDQAPPFCTYLKWRRHNAGCQILRMFTTCRERDHTSSLLPSYYRFTKRYWQRRSDNSIQTQWGADKQGRWDVVHRSTLNFSDQEYKAFSYVSRSEHTQALRILKELYVIFSSLYFEGKTNVTLFRTSGVMAPALGSDIIAPSVCVVLLL